MTQLSSEQVRTRLQGLEAHIRSTLGDAAEVTRQEFDDLDSHTVSVMPRNPRSLALVWIWADDIVVESGHGGGRWELEPTDDDLQLLGDIVAAVLAGEVTETFAWQRSSVAITLANGKVLREAGYRGCLSLLVPLPGWQRWGRRVQYQPYLSLSDVP